MSRHEPNWKRIRDQHFRDKYYAVRREERFLGREAYYSEHPQDLVALVNSSRRFTPEQRQMAKDYVALRLGVSFRGMLWGQIWRAQKAGVRVEKFTLAQVIDRDGWVCGICGWPIDRNVPWPDGQSRSIDHVIPISLGGDHVLSNVRLAHLGCNLRKGAKLDGCA